MPPDRRTVLEVAGGTLSTATLASLGSSIVAAQDDELEQPDDDGNDGDDGDDGPDDGDSDDPVDEDALPDYSRWLVLEDGALEFTAIDWDAVGEDVRAELEAAEGVEDDPDVPSEYEADPMVVLPSEGLYSSYLLVTLSLGQYGLGRLLEPEAFETTVEDLVVVNDVTVAAGEVDADEIDGQLTADPDNGFATQFEQTDEIDGADVYAPVETEDVPEQVAIAVDDETIVIADREADDDPVATLETVLEAEAGDGDRAADEADVAWLLEAAGDGDAVVGAYGEPTTGDDGLVGPEFEALADAEGIVVSTTPEDEEAATGTLAAILPDPDEDPLLDSLGISADERSFSLEDGNVTVSARWEELEEL
ncbi:hypothetical protein [Natrarchaeobaculum aegyptiacum]|uniref:Uncharacterized protein n=1 Tax=Natrarchaeobaculum aegyptiacum TaxID=745377 RepID=A0A2Z2HTX3_9EURY|nr:hypothetical protein [Natrarchaeobaculum aegyptiacum]ARS90659.1 hypothetical protein B1756_13600 [Natrarchaeobaculum aegyptiacum]